MIKYSINDSEKGKPILINKIKNLYSNGREEEIFEILKNYQESYNSALEYFATYQIASLPRFEKEIEKRKAREEWNFIINAVFDEGINCLWAFYDERATDYGNILERFKNSTGQELSTNDVSDKWRKEIRLYRNNSSAHLGNGVLEEKCQIHFATPWIILNCIRQDGKKYWNEKLEIESENFSKQDIEYVLKKENRVYYKNSQYGS